MRIKYTCVHTMAYLVGHIPCLPAERLLCPLFASKTRDISEKTSEITFASHDGIRVGATDVPAGMAVVAASNGAGESVAYSAHVLVEL